MHSESPETLGVRHNFYRKLTVGEFLSKLRQLNPEFPHLIWTHKSILRIKPRLLAPSKLSQNY